RRNSYSKTDDSKRTTDDRLSARTAPQLLHLSSVVRRPSSDCCGFAPLANFFPKRAPQGVSPPWCGAYGRTTGRADGSRRTQSVMAPAWAERAVRRIASGLARTGCATGVAALAAALWAQPSSAETIESALVKAYQNNPQLNAQRASVRATDEGVPQ